MGSTAHYSASVLADAPFWYWRLNQASGSAIADASGNNRTGSAVHIHGPAHFQQRSVVPADQVGPTQDFCMTVPASLSGSIVGGNPAFFLGNPSGSEPGDSGSFTVEWWVKPTNTSTAAGNNFIGAISTTAGQSGWGYFIAHQGSQGEMLVGCQLADRMTVTEIPSGTVKAGRSNHLVYTYDWQNQIGSFYVNARFVASKSQARPTGSSGPYWPNFFYGGANLIQWNGSVDEIAVYRGKVLPQNRIKAHFDAAFSTYDQQVLFDFPKLYWRLGDTSGSGPPIRDYSGNSRSGSFAGGAAGLTFSASALIYNDIDFAISGNNAAAGPFMQFTGSSMEIGAGGASNEFSVEWWMNPGSVSAGAGNTVGRGLGQFTAGISGSSGEAFVGIGVTDLFRPPQLGPGFFQPGKIGHYVFTYNGSVGTVYKNGFQVGRPRTMTAPSTWGSVDPFKVAVSGAWLGTYDEVAVYGYALTPNRVLDHYAQGANLSGSGFAAPVFTALSGSRALNTGGDYLIVTGSNFQMGAAVLLKSGSTIASGNFPQTDLTGTTTFIGFNSPVVPTGTYNIVVINPDSSVVTGSAVLTVVTGARYESQIVSDRPVLYWQLRDVSGSLFAADRSNMLNTGTIGNSNPFLIYTTTSLVADRGYGGFAMAEFNPSAPVPFISVTPPGFFPAAYPAQPAVGIGGPAGAQQFSVEFWIKMRTGLFPFQNLTGDGGTPRLGFNHPAFLLNVNSVANGTTTFGTDAPQAVTASSFLVTRNTTHHVVYVYSSSIGSTTGTGRLYRDGVLISGPSTQNNPTIWQAFQFLGPVSGVFDEIAVYDYPLTPEQVAIHWGTGMLTETNDNGLSSYVPLRSATPGLRSFQDKNVLVSDEDEEGLPIPALYNDIWWPITSDLTEAGVAPYFSEDLPRMKIPFDMIEGAGNIDTQHNVQFLVISSASFGGGGGGSSADTTPPSLTNFSPAFGNPIASTQVISFDVTDNSGFTRLIILHAGFPTLVGTEVIHDGETFSARNYSNISNTRTPITGGFHYTILRDGGWPSTLTLYPFAVDQSGNENT